MLLSADDALFRSILPQAVTLPGSHLAGLKDVETTCELRSPIVSHLSMTYDGVVAEVVYRQARRLVARREIALARVDGRIEAVAVSLRVEEVFQNRRIGTTLNEHLFSVLDASRVACIRGMAAKAGSVAWRSAWEWDLRPQVRNENARYVLELVFQWPDRLDSKRIDTTRYRSEVRTLIGPDIDRASPSFPVTGNAPLTSIQRATAERAMQEISPIQWRDLIRRTLESSAHDTYPHGSWHGVRYFSAGDHLAAHERGLL